jgi:hypothetical protein
MAALLIALGLFAGSWGTHLVWWRLSPPQRPFRVLVAVFIGNPVVLVAALGALGRTDMMDAAEWASVGFFHLGATLCYLITYAGIEETSPSLAIVRKVESAGAAGATLEELGSVVTNERFIDPRLASLERDGFVTVQEGNFRLTAKGRSAASAAGRLSRLFNLQLGA